MSCQTGCGRETKTKSHQWYTGVKTLGIHFSCDQEQNFYERLSDIQKTINLWSLRGLSLFGKVTIVKSFLIPKLLCFYNIGNPTRNH